MSSSKVRKLTGWLKNHAPGPIEQTAREAAAGVGRLTAFGRMVPSFIVVGAQRCGTTTLYRLLSDHPAIVRPTFAKGTGYFDQHYGRGERWYRGHFPLRATGWTRSRDGHRAVTFESSGYYCYHPLVPERIATDLPGVKLVMVVRDPAERAFSAYKHEFARGFETESFERALELEPERLRGEVERMIAEPGYASFHHQHHSYVARGQYAEQVRRLRGAVGADNVYVMDADHFFADPHREFEALTDWLGVPRWAPTDVAQWNARRSAPMSGEIRSWLLDQFEDGDTELATVMGRAPSWRS